MRPPRSSPRSATDPGEAIGFNPVDGFLYHASGYQVDRIFEKIDLVTLGITDIPLSGDPYGEALSLGFAGDGSFFLGSLEPALHRITPGGAVTTLAPLALPIIRRAWSSCPSPRLACCSDSAWVRWSRCAARGAARPD